MIYEIDFLKKIKKQWQNYSCAFTVKYVIFLCKRMSVPTKQLKFIHITKTAGTSIETVGLDNNIRWGINHKEYGFWHEEFINKSIDLKNKYDWFMVVRNPYDRILSEYAFITKVLQIPRHDKKGFNMFLKKWITNASQNIENHPIFGRKGGDHFTEQYKYYDASVCINILKFETIENDFNNLMEKYKINITLNKKIMVSTNRYFTVKDITREIIELIHTVYKRDFEDFGYEMVNIEDYPPEPPEKREIKLIGITRTANPAIEDTGLENGIRWGDNHAEYGWHYETFITKPKSLKEKYDWFMVVRNPYDRILSEYDFLLKALQITEKKSVTHFNYTINQWINNIKNNLQNHPKFGRKCGDHFTEQYKYFDSDVKITILKYESLEEDFNNFMILSKLPIKLNNSKIPLKDTTFTIDDITEENMELINRVYRNDFDLFGYTIIHKSSLVELYSEQRELKFIHATRSAGTSIEQAGLEHNIYWGRFHREYGIHDEIFINKPTELQQQYDWFIVVRNPYVRIISEYSFLSTVLKINKASDKVVFNTFISKWLKNIIDCEENHKIYGNHLIPYSYYIDASNKITVLKYENLQNDFVKLMNKYRYSITLNKRSCISKKIITVKDISKDNLNLINKVYKDDFEMFDYCIEA